MPSAGNRRAFRDGIVVEALNPKTAAFFLAFLPQFVDPSGTVWLQFAALGLISATLNTAVDIGVVFTASQARGFVLGRPALVRRLRTGAGMVIAGLGLSLLLTRRPA
jgi:threonine/homoserine/homoserine lactone efflux protein